MHTVLTGAWTLCLLDQASELKARLSGKNQGVVSAVSLFASIYWRDQRHSSMRFCCSPSLNWHVLIRNGCGKAVLVEMLGKWLPVAWSPYDHKQAQGSFPLGWQRLPSQSVFRRQLERIPSQLNTEKTQESPTRVNVTPTQHQPLLFGNGKRTPGLWFRTSFLTFSPSRITVSFFNCLFLSRLEND